MAVTAFTADQDIAEIKKFWEENGFVIVKNFLPKEVLLSAQKELEGLVQECADILFKEGKIKDKFENEPFNKRLSTLYKDIPQEAPKIWRTELNRAGLYDLFFYPKVLDLIQSILGSPEIRLFPNYTCRPKLPGAVQHVVLWHQDAEYTRDTNWHAAQEWSKEEVEMNTKRIVNIWTPLVPATKHNGCMQIVPKSQKLGLVKHLDRIVYLEIDPKVVEETTKKEGLVDLEVNPGDIVLFSQLLFHRGLENNSDIVRWSFDFRYQDAALPTLRKELGFLARSQASPEQVVKSGAEWAKLELGSPNPTVSGGPQSSFTKY